MPGSRHVVQPGDAAVDLVVGRDPVADRHRPDVLQGQRRQQLDLALEPGRLCDVRPDVREPGCDQHRRDAKNDVGVTAVASRGLAVDLLAALELLERRLAERPAEVDVLHDHPPPGPLRVVQVPHRGLGVAQVGEDEARVDDVVRRVAETAGHVGHPEPQVRHPLGLRAGQVAADVTATAADVQAVLPRPATGAR